MSDAAKDNPRYNCFELCDANFTRVADCIQAEQGLSRTQSERLADHYIVCAYEKGLTMEKAAMTTAIVIGGGIGIYTAIKLAAHLITGTPVTFTQCSPLSFGVLACLNYYSSKPLFKMRIADRLIRADDVGNNRVYKNAQRRINQEYPVKASTAPTP